MSAKNIPARILGQRMHTLSVRVSGIERNAKLVIDGGIECALHVVDRLWHKVQTKLSVRIEIIQEP